MKRVLQLTLFYACFLAFLAFFQIWGTSLGFLFNMNLQEFLGLFSNEILYITLWLARYLVIVIPLESYTTLRIYIEIRSGRMAYLQKGILLVLAAALLVTITDLLLLYIAEGRLSVLSIRNAVLDFVILLAGSALLLHFPRKSAPAVIAAVSIALSLMVHSF